MLDGPEKDVSKRTVAEAIGRFLAEGLAHFVAILVLPALLGLAVLYLRMGGCAGR